MYLTNKFKTKAKKQVNEAKAEGKAEGREEIQQAWIAWNTRRIEAETRGIPFNEHPPTLSEDTQETSK